MKKVCYTFIKNYNIILLAILLWLLSGEAMAADASGSWRPTYDLIMRYINFLILAFLIIKYARKPLVDFFKSKSLDIKKDIQNIEEAKEQVQNQVKSLLEEREKSREKFEQLKERIISQGKMKQTRIIEDAKQEGKLLLKNTNLKIDNLIIKARYTLRSEMIDLAIDLAMKKLPGEITEQDNQRLLDRYFTSTESFRNSSDIR
jgi:F-type H+-transporting ATPase subunit b